AILPHSIILNKASDISLVHVNIVYAVTGQKTKVLIRLVALRSPPFTEGVNQGLFIRHRALHDLIELLVQVIIGARKIGWKWRHHPGLQEVTADQIKCARAGVGCKLAKTAGKRLYRRGERMDKIRLDIIHQLGWSQLRSHVDRNAVVGSSLIDNMNLIVGR